MKFSSFLSFASVALAAPAVERRQLGGLLSPILGGGTSSTVQTPSTTQVPSVRPGTVTTPNTPSTTQSTDTQSDEQTVVGTILSSIRTLEAASKTNLNEINNAIASVKNNIDATLAVQLKATLEANYDAISKSIKDGSTAIALVTTGAVGGVGNQVKGLTQAQINQLVEAVNSANRILKAINATLNVTVTDLTPAFKEVIMEEIEAMKGVLDPFLTPLGTFVDAARKAGATAGLTVTGLSTAETEFLKTSKSLVSFLGLPPIPVLSGLRPLLT